MNAIVATQDRIGLQHDMLLAEIKRGLLVPVLGGDINLCGRPVQNMVPIGWKAGAEGIKYPPSTCELGLHLLDRAKEQGSLNLDRNLRELLSNFLTTQLSSPQDSMTAICLANVCQYIRFVNPLILDALLPQLLAEEYAPTPVHEFLLKLAQYRPNSAMADTRPYPCIVTACFDQVLEQHLHRNQVPFHLVAFVLAENGGAFQYTPPGHQPEEVSREIGSGDLSQLMEGFKEYPVVIKLNGGIPAGGTRNFAITEDHYIDYLSHQGIKDSLPEMLLAKLTSRTKGSRLLFLGYSPRHWNLRVILRRIWYECLNNQNKHWTVILESRFSEIDAKFWTEYALPEAELMQIDSLDDYIKRLTARLAQLPQGTSPPNAVRGQPSSTIKKANRDGVFISYSHEDHKWFKELVTMLAPVQRKLKIWHDQMIRPGAEWRKEIETALASAKAAVLLVSPDFLNSDFIQKNELPPLLDAAKTDGCKILWIKVKECLIDETPIENYQAVYNEPLINLTDGKLNRAMYDIVKKIRQETLT